MNTQAFKFPFADVDFTKAMGEFKMPAFNVEALVETQRKNVAAITAANQTAFEAVKTVAQRQADMIKLATEEFSKAASEVMSAASFEEKAVKQAEIAKKTYETAIANVREIADMIAKGNTETLEQINKRVADALDEVKSLIAKKQ
ncbi:MAG: phasin family protein [Rhodospirillales bacterium]|nr:phasin family protein [Rhodospirillales bacterium]QQS11208.1 MAG: phasin family protein [Rhodospirillales bacterium]